MDGKGRCLDNIFIEHLWRSLKYECVYLHAWETVSQARTGIGRWITFYNHQRPHAAHGGQPPAVVYFRTIETDQQVQAVAYINRISVQEAGSSSFLGAISTISAFRSRMRHLA
ncbi:transposase [Paracoccus aestuarii]|uniref:Transposase n=2 Tax=Paracoccus aestuarii TaxID=453842 RepID=A0A418ZS22_9RHOB|nr:transposase [Paracoccus aestuarii]WCR00844.1 transposase [Paracoccus aestuarii]